LELSAAGSEPVIDSPPISVCSRALVDDPGRGLHRLAALCVLLVSVAPLHDALAEKQQRAPEQDGQDQLDRVEVRSEYAHGELISGS
jgi:hypothetical protein